MRRTRVVLADSQLAFAQIVAARLDEVADLSAVGITSDRAAVRDALCAGTPDLLVIEACLDDHLTAMTSAVKQAPRLRVLVLVNEDDPGPAIVALTAGATGVVDKRANFEELLTAIRFAARGEKWISPQLLSGVLDELLQRAGPAKKHEDLAQLTDRELDVLRCLVSGMNRAAISRSLFLSTHTVRTHTRNVLAKLGAHSTLEAVAMTRDAVIGRMTVDR